MTAFLIVGAQGKWKIKLSHEGVIAAAFITGLTFLTCGRVAVQGTAEPRAAECIVAAGSAGCRGARRGLQEWCSRLEGQWATGRRRDRRAVR
ncbi:hypothetical protein SALBM311S_12722 [Streptomyces alboniger]